MNAIILKKSVVAFAVLLAVGSLGFSTAYGYGGGSGTKAKVTLCHNGHTITVAKSAVAAHLKQGDTRGACVVSPQTLVLGATFSPENRGQQYSPFLKSLSSILLSVQSSNRNGDLSNEDTVKFTTQLSQILASLMSII